MWTGHSIRFIIVGYVELREGSQGSEVSGEEGALRKLSEGETRVLELQKTESGDTEYNGEMQIYQVN